MWILNMIMNILRILIDDFYWFSGFNILKVVLKPNSMSIKKENNNNINFNLLNRSIAFCLDRQILHQIVKKTYKIIYSNQLSLK